MAEKVSEEELKELDAVEIAENDEVAETVQIDNPVECNLTIGERVYSGSLEFTNFNMAAWRKWRKAIKCSRKGLKKAGYDADEQEMVGGYWSGASIIESWDISYTENGNVVEVAQPKVGVVPPDEYDYAFFAWFRQVANNYLVPRLGFTQA